MPKLTIDGKEIEVEAGTNLIEAARRLGIEVPHYCYHPGLSIAGQCRLCMVDIEKAPRPTIACNTTAGDGMVVHTDTERVRDTRRSIMEFHLINHPLDCPVCDQAGECWLQIYYMKHGLYDPRMVDEKVHKPKAVPLGPHVMLDAERCILCSRCVRFCDEITGTGELGIFHRGDHSEIGLFPGRDLENNYSANVVDICPVGALTDRDFRFQVRVWYLDTTKSICTGCARGCNVDVHVNRRRPHHAEGRRVARLKPRFNAEVNAWWLCDIGRYHFDFVDAATRLTAPVRRNPGGPADVTWDEAVAGVADALRRYPPEQVAVLASPQMANEDLIALRRVLETRGIREVAFDVPPTALAKDDDFLLRADRTPNRRGATLIGLGGDAGGLMAAARSGRIKCLWVFHHDLLAAGWPAAEVSRALGRIETVIFTGTNANATSERAHWVLPAAAWVEREGTFTNFEGRVQRFRTALEPLGQALPEWELLGRVLVGLGGTAAGRRAEHWFRELTGAVDAFAGMSYQSLGDLGRLVAGATASGLPTPPGQRASAHA
ncbi:MAG: 2Fe-2S iron-sulfur cluster binding domain-containing protein [Candidatus Rokuibacteriota bacterium]|nr:MAG: 2Fe-2S iron-sulfur cluster binding domain-containing protein [Candidatus Rokubacteria bacterium]